MQKICHDSVNYFLLIFKVVVINWVQLIQLTPSFADCHWCIIKECFLIGTEVPCKAILSLFPAAPCQLTL